VHNLKKDGALKYPEFDSEEFKNLDNDRKDDKLILFYR